MPGYRIYNGTFLPELTAAPSAPAGTCNAYIPSTSTMDRFVYIVNFLADNGLYVVRAHISSGDREIVQLAPGHPVLSSCTAASASTWGCTLPTRPLASSCMCRSLRLCANRCITASRKLWVKESCATCQAHMPACISVSVSLISSRCLQVLEDYFESHCLTLPNPQLWVMAGLNSVKQQQHRCAPFAKSKLDRCRAWTPAALQVLENHFETDRSALSNPQQWVNNWANLVTVLAGSTATARRLMISPLSNPDSGNITCALSQQALQWQ